MIDITTVCGHCRNHDKDAKIEINFRDAIIYYMCPECKKESKLELRAKETPFPKSRGLR